MKGFRKWLHENASMPSMSNPIIRNSDMESVDETKINSYLNIARRAAEKHSDKFIDSMWRLAKDTEDDELQEMLSKVDSRHGPHKKTGFGFEDESDHLGSDKEVVPNSADHGMGDADLD